MATSVKKKIRLYDSGLSGHCIIRPIFSYFAGSHRLITIQNYDTTYF